jgi:transposase
MIDLQTKISKIKKDNVQDDPQIDVMMRELKTMKNNAQKNPEDIPGYVKDMLAIKKQDDTFITQCKVIGLDPGKRNAATWVHHDPEKQRIHNQWKKEQHTKPEERFKSGCLTGNQWIYESGQKQYTKKMKKRMDVMVPEWRSMRTTKTVNTDALMEVYAFQIHLWPQIHQAFFAEKWFAKMRMRRFCKKQKALDDVVTRITGTKQKDEQKKVVIAYGNGDNQATLRGTQSMMSTTLATKLKRCCTVVFVDEFRTSANCSCCHEEMKQKNYRVKWCINTSCTRSLWNRDINAAINILLLFLQKCHDGSKSQRFKRENRL